MCIFSALMKVLFLTVSNAMLQCFITFCFNCFRHGRNATYEQGLGLSVKTDSPFCHPKIQWTPSSPPKNPPPFPRRWIMTGPLWTNYRKKPIPFGAAHSSYDIAYKRVPLLPGCSSHLILRVKNIVLVHLKGLNLKRSTARAFGVQFRVRSQ